MAFNFFLVEGESPHKPFNPDKSEKIIIKASEMALTLLALKSPSFLKREVKQAKRKETF